MGDWRLDVRRNEISRGSETVRLEPKVAELLAQLARRQGDVVGREELLSLVWPGVVVGDDALTQAIIKLRKALGDDAHAPKYIETISKRGYRLLASVDPALAEPSSVRRRSVALGASAAVALLLVVGWFFAPALPWPIGSPPRQAQGSASIPTIAVLPLANQSGDPQREYFSDGMTEDVINALGRFSGVRVLASSAVQSFKGKPAVPREVREALGARYVVHGSVRVADRKVRVTVALMDGETGTQLWSGRHDGEGDQLFDIQDRIVQGIAGALHLKVSELEEQRSLARPAASLEAHDLLLRARSLINTSSRTANREARAHLARATELSPDYAELPTELGRAEFQRVTNGWVEDAASSLKLAEALAQKALASPDTRAHARAHSLLASLYSHQDRYADALDHANKAIALNPSESLALYWRGHALLASGRIDESIAVLEAARRIEPHPAPGQGLGLATAYYLAGRHADALWQADALLVRYTQHPYLRAVRAAALAQMGRDEDAHAEADRIRRMSPLFDPDQLGSYLGEPQRSAMREGLRKAGM